MDLHYLEASNHLDDLRREAREESLARVARRHRVTGRVPKTVGHLLIFLGRVIAAEPTC